MDRFEQIYQLHKELKKRRTPISRVDLQNQLGMTRTTTTRLIRFCRDRLCMPIEFDRERNGYHYGVADREGFELPGLWFNPSELVALMTSHRLLAEVQPGILEPYLAPYHKRIQKLLEHKRAGSKEIFKRVRILQMANRVARIEDFQKAADALVTRKQLRIQYSSRSKEELLERWISPQRLIYYRDNWYLDAWCHLRDDLRTFSLDCMNVTETGRAARDVSDQQLDAHATHTYGIFGGAATDKAVIHFSSNAARWVADEQWHPEQQSTPLDNGRWELIVPYGNPTELVRDILSYGPDAEVIAPPELRALVTDKLSLALGKYRNIKNV